MKTITTKRFMGFLAALVTATAAFRSPADQTATAPKNEKTCTGTVMAVDPQEHTLQVSGWLMTHKDFNLGNPCAFVQLDKPSGMISDLRPGEKVTVSYQAVHGVKIADRVQQLAMQTEGEVKAIDPANNTLTIHGGGMDRQLTIGSDCNVVLLHQTSGVIKDIRPGDHVKITYETPGSQPVAREIAQTSLEYSGNLTAIDLEARTVKAGTAFDSRKFNLADNCAIVINGRIDGQLGDLKPNDKLTLSYDEIKGVNVVNRIGVLESPAKGVASYSPPAGAY